MTTKRHIINPFVNWNILSQHPNAIHLLEQNKDKVNWYYLYQ
jgi:hypothetical protein